MFFDAQKLGYWRRYRGLSMRQLADKSWVNQSTLSRWEGGKAMPTIRALQAVADALGVEIGELCTQAT